MLDPYRLAVDELVVKFTHVKQEYQDARIYSPIESVTGRVKRISSILDKAHRKGANIKNKDVLPHNHIETFDFMVNNLIDSLYE